MPDRTPHPLKVLVVDDERSITDTLALIFKAAGFETALAYSGEDAVAAAATFRPDILVSDYSMPPGMNGLEAAQKIKRMLPGCRVLMLSGQFLGEEFQPYKQKGYNFVLLSKPIHPAELLRTVAKDSVVCVEQAKPSRILNVDDVEEHRYSISRILAHAGFEVTEAATGTEALRQALEGKPELVVLDIHLPDIDGYDVCAALKNGSETARIAVVHVTNSDRSPESAMRSAKAGADAYLAYPIEPKRLVKRIRELLQITYLKEEAPGQ